MPIFFKISKSSKLTWANDTSIQLIINESFITAPVWVLGAGLAVRLLFAFEPSACQAEAFACILLSVKHLVVLFNGARLTDGRPVRQLHADRVSDLIS